MNLDQFIALLLGAGFGARALDSKKSALARIGYGLVGYDLLKTGLTGQGTLLGPTGAQNTSLVKSGNTARKPKFEERRVKTIAERVAYVHEQMVKGTRDPDVYRLAREVLARRNPDGSWVVPEKDYMGELTALFNEARARCRYTMDPVDYDAFQTPSKTLEFETGDCDDEMSLLGAMVRTVGMQVRSRIVQTEGNTTWNHIYPMAQRPDTGEWVALDLAAIGKPAGWEVPKKFIIRQRDFDVLEKEVPKLQAMMGVDAKVR